MKQAILITAYQNLTYMSRLLDYFDADFDLYIHIDKKCREDYSFFMQDKRVHLFNKYSIEWGGSNHIRAIVLLMTEACKNREYGFFHLITGSDLPAKSLQVFKHFFEEHRDENYMHYFPLPAPGNHWGEDGGLGRLDYFYFINNLLDIRNTKHTVVRIDRKLRKLHSQYLPKRRFRFFEQLFGGSTYWSLSANAVNYAVGYFKQKPSFLRRFRFTLIGEEIFLHTVLLNNPDIRVENNYLRFMRWDEYGTKPEILVESDFESLQHPDVFFARKFDENISGSLIDRINKIIF